MYLCVCVCALVHVCVCVRLCLCLHVPLRGVSVFSPECVCACVWGVCERLCGKGYMLMDVGRYIWGAQKPVLVAPQEPHALYLETGSLAGIWKSPIMLG